MTFRPARQPEADTVFIKHSQLKAELLNKLSLKSYAKIAYLQKVSAVKKYIIRS